MAKPAGELLPHQRTARLLTHVLHHNSDSIEVIGEISSEHPLVHAGRAPNFLGIELGAQAAAALEAIIRREATSDDSPRIGYLVRVRDVVFYAADLPVTTPLVVTAYLEDAAPPMAMYRITVTAGSELLVSAELSTYSRS